MSTASLNIDLAALQRNWKALDAKTAPEVETSAVVKANGYGLDSGKVAKALLDAGARRFFVAVAEEAVAVRKAVGPDVKVCIFSGHMAGDTDLIRDLNLIPMLNSTEQLRRHFEALPMHAFGVQLDSGMNRLGMEPGDWAEASADVLVKGPDMIMSHLACADEPDHAMNPQQLAAFRQMTDGLTVPLSLSATGGTLILSSNVYRRNRRHWPHSGEKAMAVTLCGISSVHTRACERRSRMMSCRSPPPVHTRPPPLIPSPPLPLPLPLPL